MSPNKKKKETPWQWGASEQRAFEETKEKLTSSTVLVPFDPSLHVGISCDSSDVGIGAGFFSTTTPTIWNGPLPVHQRHSLVPTQVPPNTEGGLVYYFRSQQVPSILIWAKIHPGHRPQASTHCSVWTESLNTSTGGESTRSMGSNLEPI